MNALRRSSLLAALLLGVFAAPALADHHLMQIERVIGGVLGDPTAQAIQLRMRSSFQNVMANGRIRAWDAAGANPVMVIDFVSNVPNHGTGVRVLVLSNAMIPNLNGTSNADYIMTNPIPASYLPAGSLTFEDNFGTIWWRVSWGGASYTGSGSVNVTNDAQADGNFNPPFASPLPSTTTQALVTSLTAAAGGVSTLADYAVPVGDAVLTNNAGTSRTVAGTVSVGPPVATGIQLGAPSPNPANGALSYLVSLDRSTHVRVEVFTPAGRLVRTIEDRVLPAGRTLLAWDPGTGGAPLGSGVYYMRLTADGVQRSRTFSVIR